MHVCVWDDLASKFWFQDVSIHNRMLDLLSNTGAHMESLKKSGHGVVAVCTHYVIVSVLSGQVQGDLTLIRLTVHWGAWLQQQLHGLWLSLPCCIMQRPHPWKDIWYYCTTHYWNIHVELSLFKIAWKSNLKQCCTFYPCAKTGQIFNLRMPM